QSATWIIAAQARAGITFDGTPKVSALDAQPSYIPRVETVKAAKSNYVWDGSNELAMVKMRKETDAQGVDTVRVWACSINCYTKLMLSAGGHAVDGTYLWMQLLPFEARDKNPELAAYVASVGADKADAFGAQAWQTAG